MIEMYCFYISLIRIVFNQSYQLVAMLFWTQLTIVKTITNSITWRTHFFMRYNSKYYSFSSKYKNHLSTKMLTVFQHSENYNEGIQGQVQKVS